MDHPGGTALVHRYGRGTQLNESIEPTRGLRDGRSPGAHQDELVADARTCGRTVYGRSKSTSGRQVARAQLFIHPSFAIWYCPEPRSMVASRRRRTAPLRWRSTRRMPFRGQDDPGFESSLDDSL